MIGMREILVNFANLTKSDIVGMRAPFLKPGRNTQYEVFIYFLYTYIYNRLIKIYIIYYFIFYDILKFIIL